MRKLLEIRTSWDWFEDHLWDNVTWKDIFSNQG
jgi:hypothetical protein